MKTLLLKLFLLLTFLFLSSGDTIAQVVWTKHEGPVITGTSASWYKHLFQPNVLYNADSSRYEMWFGAGYSNNRPYQIGFATSKDGISWTMHPDPVLIPTAGSWDSFTVEWPWVIRENGEYKMWYTGAKNFPELKIGYATSPDGINWTKYEYNPVFGVGSDEWEALAVGTGDIISFNGEYKMWYTGASTDLQYCIGYATSTDGIMWQRDMVNNPVIVPGYPGNWDELHAYAPRLLIIDGIYYMWYSSDDGVKRQVGLATSPDGIFNWKKHEGNPVLKPSPGKWDSELIEGGSLLITKDTLFYWYNGSSDPGILWQIGLATSPFIPVPVAVNDISGAFDTYVLEQNYPNPFNPSTTIGYGIKERSNIKITVLNLIGEEVAMLLNEEKNPGYHTIEFNAGILPSGVYFYRIAAGEYTAMRKMLLIK
jgi:beta-1,2-mannobiose phosphorylase / 1,2-beta-oligomannan phosphorylase